MAKETPLMKQYKEIKSQYKDEILFFRLGDFYEMFFEDAVTASKELGLTLTSRNKEKDVNIPLAGIPYHSSAQYISKLVKNGYKVAICEQVEDPKETKGIVKREVVKVITPGTVIDIDTINDKSNNYIFGVIADEKGAGIAYIDITTGEFYTQEFIGKDSIKKAINEINKYEYSELVTNEITNSIYKKEFDEIRNFKNITIGIIEEIKNPIEFINEYFEIVSLESFGISDKKYSIQISANLLNYILELNKHNSLPINKISYVFSEHIMSLDFNTQDNLELLKNNIDKGENGSLLWVLDKTKTSAGGRMLKKIVTNPLLNYDKIVKRQNDIEFFMQELLKKEEIKEELKNVYDIERLVGKLVFGTENGKDLIALKKSLISIKKIGLILDNNTLLSVKSEIMDRLIETIENAIVENPPFSIREGGILKTGYNEELDKLRDISNSGKNYLLEIEKTEKENTGIKSLKIKYNKVFGYFLEVTKSYIDLVPETYIRKQTLANAERYITPELKEYENKILGAKDRIEDLEYELFKSLSQEIKQQHQFLQEIANKISYIDVIISFTDVALQNGYVKPEITEGYELEIEEGRHPVVEKLLKDEDYVRNNITMKESENFVVLTGPNMAGKSTYMKQNAIIIILAQIGSFVPAQRAIIGIVDKIFTRVGASDNLVSGQSTFMVEMSEVANIVNNATKKSFIILDEVGRGTSTFDGISIAWAISEYIHNHISAKTLFATHYHELTELSKELSDVVNYRIEVKETQSSVIFLRKIVKGGADKSYGIEVAKLAGLPEEILKNGRKLLSKLEKRKELIEKKANIQQLSLFGETMQEVEKRDDTDSELFYEIMNLDLNNITPLEALNRLHDLKKRLVIVSN